MKLNVKKVWSVTWKTLTGVALSFIVILGGFLLDEYDENGNRKSYEYQPIGYYQIHYRYGLLDRQTGLPLTPAIYSEIRYVTPNLFDCELADGYVDDHVFISAKGKIIQ